MLIKLNRIMNKYFKKLRTSNKFKKVNQLKLNA